MYKLAIFDFDGTLVDSAPGIVEIMYQVKDYYGFHDDIVEQWKHLIGISLNDQTKTILPDHDPDFQLEVANKYREFYNSQAIELCPPFPSLGRVLEQLKSNDINITIASSKKTFLIDPVLEHHGLESFFSLVLGSNHVANHKPHPESVNQTLKHLGCEPDEAIVIGDSIFDLEMAKNASVDSIGITTGVHDREILGKASPISVVDSLPEAIDLILEGKEEAA